MANKAKTSIVFLKGLNVLLGKYFSFYATAANFYISITQPLDSNHKAWFLLYITFSNKLFF